MTPRVDPKTIKAYRQSCLDICAARLADYSSMAEIAAEEAKINAYPRLAELEEPREVVTLDAVAIPLAQRKAAVECVLDGRFLAEHAAAGEGTRLKMGTKYLINPCQHLSLAACAEMLAEEEERAVSEREILDRSGGAGPEDLLDLSLGARHMLQMAFDLTRLAQENGRHPQTVLEDQWSLIILNETSADQVAADLAAANFYGFNPERVLAMIQVPFEGINLKNGRFFFDPAAPKRLHNHGQMAMQQTAENQIFRPNPGRLERCEHLSPAEVAQVLEGVDDKLSYNIEDLSYLTGALDLDALALALELGRGGARMVMEIVANNPLKPQKGGLAAWDRVLGRNVMVESFQLVGLKNEDIRFLNRNFNHYPKPLAAFEASREGLPMPIAVKKGFLYFQPVQGDLNFLLKTTFVQRKILKPISNWKSAATTPAALQAMAAQDAQPDFKEFAEDILKRSL